MIDAGKGLIDYKFVPSGEHLRIEPIWAGRHPQEAIDYAKTALERYARSQYDEIKIYSKKCMGRVYFHVSGMQQMIDWQPAKAPPRNSHRGEVRARGGQFVSTVGHNPLDHPLRSSTRLVIIP